MQSKSPRKYCKSPRKYAFGKSPKSPARSRKHPRKSIKKDSSIFTNKKLVIATGLGSLFVIRLRMILNKYKERIKQLDKDISDSYSNPYVPLELKLSDLSDMYTGNNIKYTEYIDKINKIHVNENINYILGNIDDPNKIPLDTKNPIDKNIKERTKIILVGLQNALTNNLG